MLLSTSAALARGGTITGVCRILTACISEDIITRIERE